MLRRHSMFGFRCDAWVRHLLCMHLLKSKGAGGRWSHKDVSLTQAVKKGRWELHCEE